MEILGHKTKSLLRYALVPLGFLVIIMSFALTLDDDYSNIMMLIRNFMIMLFFFVIIFMWFIYRLEFAQRSGWKAMANKFSGFDGSSLSYEATLDRGSAVVGDMYVNGVLSITISDKGIIIKFPIPFSFANPPLFFPWDSVRYIKVGEEFPLGRPKFSSMVDRLKKSDYASITLKELPNQILVVPWLIRFSDVVRKIGNAVDTDSLIT